MKRIIWGVFLVVLGSLMLFERVGGLHVPEGTLWPLLVFALAASAFAERRIGSGVMFTLIGTVFLMCTLGLYGMSYAKSWPLIMIAVGLGIVLRAVIHDPPRRWWYTEVNRG